MCHCLAGDGAQARVSNRHGKSLIALVLAAASDLASLQKKEHKLDKVDRPEAIGNWQKSGRKYEAMPDLSDDRLSFSRSWWQWWRKLQPSWRTQAPLALSRQVPSNTDWSAMEKGTANGFFVVILALGWWAFGVKHAGIDTGDDVDDLMNAIDDTTWVLDQMALSRSNKRQRLDGGEDKTRAKRCAIVFRNIIHISLIFIASNPDRLA
jgi:hypothetical protein